MNKLKTPMGVIKWEGELNIETVLTFEDGTEATLLHWITLTNGAAIEWIEEAQEKEKTNER
jgi:hypothetical protein